jgi:SulP family sulfate permease
LRVSSSSHRPSFVELFTPKLITVLREGYGLRDLRADALAGLTVAIVALPLSMAIAIASGVTPERGLTTSIVGGFIVSLLGGSRFQVGGPAGAFIVLVAGTVAAHGVEGLILATMLGGLLLVAVGFLRLGTFVKYIPYPVTVGFTGGIAVIIVASQAKELLGLALVQEPGPLVPKLLALAHALPSWNGMAVIVALLTLGVILVLRRWWPHWPAFVIAVGTAALLVWAFDWPVETIGSRFGGIPHLLAAPSLPPISLAKVIELLPAALSFALLGSIESLLSAVVADSMTGRRHRSNCELVAQGAANIASALFGGFCTTGLIARTATNVRAGARGPVAGIFHSLFLLGFMLVAAPLASFLPLSALAAILALVAWNMVEKRGAATLLRASRGDAVVLLATFALTILQGLSEGILVGFAISALLFLHRMAQAVHVERMEPLIEEDCPDSMSGVARPYDPAVASDRNVVTFRISGAFFFGAAGSVAAVLDRLAESPKAYVIDFAAVAIIDSTAATTIESFVRKAQRRGAAVYITGTKMPVRRILLTHGVRPPQVRFKTRLADAVLAAQRELGSPLEAPLPADTAA